MLGGVVDVDPSEKKLLGISISCFRNLFQSLKVSGLVKFAIEVMREIFFSENREKMRRILQGVPMKTDWNDWSKLSCILIPRTMYRSALLALYSAAVHYGEQESLSWKHYLKMRKKNKVPL